MLRFPIRESSGRNKRAQPLQEHEIATMKDNPTIMGRIVKSYELMLDFYGMRLVNTGTGVVVERCKNYEERYRNLVGKFLLLLLRQDADL
jgi:hypothetical protein